MCNNRSLQNEETETHLAVPKACWHLPMDLQSGVETAKLLQPTFLELLQSLYKLFRI